jgi:transposase
LSSLDFITNKCIFRLTEDQIEVVKTWIDVNLTITLAELVNLCETDFYSILSVSTMARYIEGFYYTFKRVNRIALSALTEVLIQERLHYAEWFLNLPPNSNIIYLDEVGVNVSMRAEYGRSKSGRRAEGTVPVIKSRNITILAAMTKDRLLHYEVLEAYQNGNAVNFGYFIDDLGIVRNNNNLYDSIIVMDNVPFHRNHAIRELLYLRGFVVKYLPAYSPFLNPIENLFSQWKRHIKNKNVKMK